MPETRTCPQCGAPLPADAPRNICPQCLLLGALSPEPAPAPSVTVEYVSPPPRAADLMAALGGQVRFFGDYELLGEIARGGMGVVFRARQLTLNRVVALKMMAAGKLASPAAVARFHNETEAAARLEHPNIVPIYDVGEQEGLHFFTMKLVEGGSLSARISNRTSQISNSESAQIVATVARAVHYAHQRGILHRDLKPANILLDADGQPYVTDFGLAKLVEQESSLTPSLAVIGTPSFMAPEQAAGRTKQLSTAADIYSLGAVLYALLTGRPPFRGDTELETIRQVVEDEPPRPQLLNPEVDRDLQIICLKCLQKEPAHRYNSAEALASDLERWRAGETISARATSTGEKVWRWCRRKPALASVGTAALLLLLAVSIGGPVAAFRIDQERKRVAKLAKEEATARNAAEHNAQQAKDSAEEASAVLRFFELKVLAATRPKKQQGGLGKDVTIRVALDAAEPDIAKSFADRPLIEARIRFVLGTTYGFLGDQMQATQQFNRALELRQLHFPPDDPETLWVMSNLAESSRLAGRFAESIALNEKTLALRQSRLGSTNRDTLQSLENLASAYKAAGRISNALSLYEKALELCRTHLGPDDPQTLGAANGVASIYQLTGKISNSLVLARQTLERRRKILGPEDLDTIVSIEMLAESERLSGNFSNAVTGFEQALEAFQSILGPEHRDTLIAMNNLATTCFQIGQRDRSLDLYEHVLKVREANLAPDAPDTISALQHLIDALFRAGRYADVEPRLRRLHDYQQRVLPADSNELLNTKTMLAQALLQQEKFADAESFIRDWLSKPGNSQTGRTIEFAANALLGWSLLGQKRFTDAERLLGPSIEGLKQRQVVSPTSNRAKFIKEAGERVAQLYEDWGKPDKAAEWREKLR